MLQILKADARGQTRLGWLDSRHSFSFGDYYDAAHMGFESLRVINDDIIAPGGGFGMHPHRDMEILTFVLEGALQHRDSLGTSSVIRPGEVQRMTAGTGIRHSEFNPSPSERVHLYQIWIQPRQSGLTPSYEQKTVADGVWSGLRKVASPQGGADQVRIEQDVDVSWGRLGEGKALTVDARRPAWVQVLDGSVVANEAALAAGDAVAVTAEPRLELKGHGEFLLFQFA
jgi:redox-sensitive bicupin YhaK (pirin superfamily)